MHLVPFVGVVISVCLCFTLENFWNIYIFFSFGWVGGGGSGLACMAP